MIRFLVRRALRGLLVIWLITLVLFGMFFVAPSNVAQTLGGRQATPETIALINQRLGLDRPIWQQYLSFLGSALRGDLGYDYYKQIPVTSIIADALPKTASIAFGAAVIWMLLGVTNGVLSAVRPRSFRRPRAHRVLAVLLLDADVPARPPAALLPVLPAHPGRDPRSSRRAGTSISRRARPAGCST